MTSTANTSRADAGWRWTLRVVGISVFVACVVAVLAGAQVPIVIPVIAAGMMGLDSIQGFELRRRQNGGSRG